MFRNSYFIFYIFSFLFLGSASANDFGAILKSIETNSVKLQAVHKQVEASVSDIKADNSLQDPEVGFNYLWGNHNLGHRIDFNVTQSFDFPSTYVQRHKLYKIQKENMQTTYLSQRQDLLLHAKKLCLEVVYCNAMLCHISKDLQRTQQMEASADKLYNQGQLTAIEYHKVQQSAVYFQEEYQMLLTHRLTLLTQLTQLNGGKNIIITDSTFTFTPLSKDFQQWLSAKAPQQPVYQLALGKLKEQEQKLKLSRHEMLPGIKIGYMLENEKIDHYQGISLGLTIPIWKGNKKVKAAKKQLEVAQLEEQNTQDEIICQIWNSFKEAQNLQLLVVKYQSTISKTDNEELLNKSLQAGKINRITYLEELQWGHEMYEKQIQLQWQYAEKLAELTSCEL